MDLRRVCVFCGSSVGVDPAYVGADLADGFMALPGGFGTFEESCALLDVAGFYAPLVDLFDAATAQGFIRPEHRRLVLVAGDPHGVLDALASREAPPPTRKWVGQAG